MKEPTTQVWTRVTPKFLREFDRVAKRNGESRAQMIASLMAAAVRQDGETREMMRDLEPQKANSR